MAIEVPQNEEISGGGKDGGREGVGSAIRWEGADRGAYTLRNDTEEELLREMFDLYIIRVGIKRRKRGSRKFRKG